MQCADSWFWLFMSPADVQSRLQETVVLFGHRRLFALDVRCAQLRPMRPLDRIAHGRRHRLKHSARKPLHELRTQRCDLLGRECPKDAAPLRWNVSGRRGFLAEHVLLE